MPVFVTFKTRVLCWPRPEDAYSLQKDVAWVIKSAVKGSKKVVMSRVGDVRVTGVCISLGCVPILP